MHGISRRTFIQWVGVGLGVLGLPAWRVVRGARVRCVACQARIRPHEYREGAQRGKYCPNCGIELTRLTWNLTGEVRNAPDWMKRKVTTESRLWTFNHVPFPNRTLVADTSKPAVRRLEIRW